MLQLKEIRKTYHAGGFDQAALDGVSVTFRDSEFVAILGPSGSGKTTLLNIIGGLDRYDSGDLVIDSVSTSEYSDRDWDTYRNNRIGFVFQSYNLIPHQTVLANVELALTLSGVERDERRRRSLEALEKVGLQDHVNKLPSQLSGGQMQRVAIARALINDPEILLADEPTGALDSKTSVTVMNLLQEISQDRLVVMVTHNPELADTYATRKVLLHDGRVTGDTDPFTPPAETRSAKEARRTSMSFLTAVSLSFKNLMTKKGRTIMTSFAGSIGIIGIALILALANGVDAYIRGVEEETLSLYPLQITSQGIDMTSLMASAMGLGGGGDSNGDADAEAHEVKMVTSMFDQVGNNDLKGLKAYFESGQSDIDDHVNTIQYNYPVTPQIYADDTDNVRQVNPNQAFSSLGFSSDSTSSSLVSSTMSMSMDVFASLPDDVGMVKDQYLTVAGRWPEAYNEVILVLSGSGGVSDFVLYTMGLRDPAELDSMVQSMAENKPVDAPDDTLDVTYDQLMDTQFKLLEASDFYQWDDEYQLFTDMRSSSDYMKSLVADGTPVKVVGIVKPDPDATANMLNMGLYYPSEMVHHLMASAADSDIVKYQLAHPDTDIFTGKTFADQAANPGMSDFDFASLISIDSEALQNLFAIDPSAFSNFRFDTSALDVGEMTGAMPQIDAPDLASLLSGMNVSVDPAALEQVMSKTIAAFLLDVYGFDLDDPSTWPSVLPTSWPTSWPTTLPTATATSPPTASATGTEAPTALPGDPSATATPSATPTESGSGSGASLPSVSDISADFSEWLNRPDVQAQLATDLGAAFNAAELQDQIAASLGSYLQQTMTSALTSMMGAMQSQIQVMLQASMAQLTSQMSAAMNMDAETFGDIFQFNMDEEQLTTFLTSLLSTSVRTLDSNLQQLGYATEDSPSGIDIYPIDFESKQQVVDILDDYNQAMSDSGQEDKVITYTDIVGTLMTSVTDIIDKISMVLVAFVSISLVVSSLMIGVITYISVLERKKEIGILRALGASKRNVGNVFNAETLILGFVAGVMGVLTTLLLATIANPIVEHLANIDRVARLPLNAAIFLVLISMLLTFVAGLFPSSAAARQDPVESLRSE